MPSNVTDGNTSTYWESADGAAYPQTITVNLGSAQSIGSITLDLPPATAWATRTETLSVLGSTNGTSVQPDRRARPGTPSTRPPATR